jgi:hypothetical protein
MHRTCRGIEASRTPHLMLYPNPARDELVVRFSGYEGTDWNLDLIDPLGRVIQSRSSIVPGKGQLVWDVRPLAGGTYCFRLHRSGESHTVRFIKL